MKSTWHLGLLTIKQYFSHIFLDYVYMQKKTQQPNFYAWEMWVNGDNMKSESMPMKQFSSSPFPQFTTWCEWWLLIPWAMSLEVVSSDNRVDDFSPLCWNYVECLLLWSSTEGFCVRRTLVRLNHPLVEC